MFNILYIFGITLLVVFFLLPTILAANRGNRYIKPILALNILGGWTVVGWIIALAWALAPGTGREG